MQTKPCPFVPTATWTLGNCLISNFGEVPAGLCFYNLSSLHVTCFQHVVTVIFSLHSLSCNRTRQAARYCLHREECVCMRGHVLERRGHSHGQLERENLKKQEAACGKKSFTVHSRHAKQNGRRAILRDQMWKTGFGWTQAESWRKFRSRMCTNNVYIPEYE